MAMGRVIGLPPDDEPENGSDFDRLRPGPEKKLLNIDPYPNMKLGKTYSLEVGSERYRRE
jgi:hypothetical protein